jgi:chromosomal replication initiation ATPase DnaA
MNNGEIKARMQEVIPAHFNLTFDDLVYRARTREVCYARDMLCFFLRKRLGTHLVVIGNLLGGRTHPTVIRSVNNILRLSKVYPSVKEDIRAIDEQLKAVNC